ncbi:hypothetical protein BZG36_00673 [Bifiguratus adelaidae]|uniref:Uncharacterized protein n=1 Tax=Bifiguratus adelaidae TaxID=1938954 RepID=A0A261Y6X8_9FUNG|nr:hypothetical protein BZG36_00673 [Bifiguratus adelaidae]
MKRYALLVLLVLVYLCYPRGKRWPTTCQHINYRQLDIDTAVWDKQSTIALFAVLGNYDTFGHMTDEPAALCLLVLFPEVSLPYQLNVHVTSDGVDYPIVHFTPHRYYDYMYMAEMVLPHSGLYHAQVSTRNNTSTSTFKSLNTVEVRPGFQPRTITNSLPARDTLPLCDYTQSLDGRFVHAKVYSELYPLDIWGLLPEMRIDDHVYVPDQCRMEYTAPLQGVQCLGSSVVYVIGPRMDRLFQLTVDDCDPLDECPCGGTPADKVQLAHGDATLVYHASIQEALSEATMASVDLIWIGLDPLPLDVLSQQLIQLRARYSLPTMLFRLGTRYGTTLRDQQEWEQSVRQILHLYGIIAWDTIYIGPDISCPSLPQLRLEQQFLWTVTCGALR